MASSKCPSCSNQSFELVELIPSGSSYKMNSIQCSHCGAVAGIVDYTNTEYLINKQSKEINEIHSSLDIINRNLRSIIGLLKK